MQAANSCGMDFAFVTYGYTPLIDLNPTKHKINYIIDNIMELNNINEVVPACP